VAQKINISSLVNSKLNNKKEDEEEEKLNNKQPEFKTLMSENNDEQSELKNKSLTDVLTDLKDIEENFSLNDIVDSPEEMNVQKIDVPNKTEEDLITITQNSLSNKYKTKKEQEENSFNQNIEKLLKKQEEYNNKSKENKKEINEIYDNLIEETEDQALKRGLARSSIVIEQIADLNQNKALELTNEMNNLQTNLSDNYKEIENLEKEKELALNNLDIAYAIELEEKLETVKTDYDKSVKQAIEFNNNVEKLKAQYKLDKEKQNQDKLEFFNKLNETSKNDYLFSQIKQAQFDYLKTYFDTLDKDYAIDLFLTNKELKTILGDNYSKMYKHLTNR